ncbi:hypothetical protein [Prosthecomicrobium sp. N25]|uniref:hypothetical protein n=1 Tax=Prosthecomicrobium sp. N25 TaxID=3129254 RepID=UPI00307832DD
MVTPASGIRHIPTCRGEIDVLALLVADDCSGSLGGSRLLEVDDAAADVPLDEVPDLFEDDLVVAPSDATSKRKPDLEDGSGSIAVIEALDAYATAFAHPNRANWSIDRRRPLRHSDHGRRHEVFSCPVPERAAASRAPRAG